MDSSKSQRHVPIKFQRGMMLLEGLIAILIFSLGILAMVGMQAVSIGHTSQAKYRLDATFAANKLIGRIWADTANRANYAGTIVSGIASGGAGFKAWKATDFEPNMPPGALSSATVTVVPFAPTPMTWVAPFALTGHMVTINIQWRLPSEPATLPPHVYVTTTQITS